MLNKEQRCQKVRIEKQNKINIKLIFDFPSSTASLSPDSDRRPSCSNSSEPLLIIQSLTLHGSSLRPQALTSPEAVPA